MTANQPLLRHVLQAELLQEPLRRFAVDRRERPRLALIDEHFAAGNVEPPAAQPQAAGRSRSRTMGYDARCSSCTSTLICDS